MRDEQSGRRLLGIGEADHPAGNSRTGIAHGLAAVVRFGMDDDRSTDNRVFLAHDGNVIDRDFIMGLAIAVRLDVAQVARVPVLGPRQAVLVAFWIVMSSRTHAVGRRTIAILVNMEGVLLAGRQSLDIGNDFYGVAILRETHHAVTMLARSRVQYRHCLRSRGEVRAAQAQCRGEPERRKRQKSGQVFHSNVRIEFVGRNSILVPRWAEGHGSMNETTTSRRGCKCRAWTTTLRGASRLYHQKRTLGVGRRHVRAVASLWTGGGQRTARPTITLSSQVSHGGTNKMHPF
jgi:hypothetical protein